MGGPRNRAEWDSFRLRFEYGFFGYIFAGEPAHGSIPRDLGSAAQMPNDTIRWV
jgi:hypothetical protein